MNFATAARNKSKWTETENGAVALNTTSNAVLDLFATIGALRGADQTRIERLFAEAYKQDKLLATKTVFYARDIREGCGERETFRILLKYMANYHPEALRPNIDKIGEYGRFDDWYSLIDTPLEDAMWEAMKAQFEEDYKNYLDQKPVSLLAKWVKTVDASSPRTKALGIKTALKLGYQPPVFKRMIRRLRNHLRVTEGLMSTNQWDKIEYSEVSSIAMKNYAKAFGRHDEERFAEYVHKAVTGEEKINSSTLYPYDLMEQVIENSYQCGYLEEDVIEAQWRQLPNYVEPGTNAIVMADTSGSMLGRPLASALGLAVYFAQRNTGPYHNLWMSFSAKPEIQTLKGETLSQMYEAMDSVHWGFNTDLHAAFQLILDIANKNHVPPSEMPKSLIVISDMEIDRCDGQEWTFYGRVAYEFALSGYEIPNIIFWNVASRHDVFHADSTRKGVQLVGGHSTTIFKQLVGCIGMTPVEMMLKVLNGPRYDLITVEG